MAPNPLSVSDPLAEPMEWEGPSEDCFVKQKNAWGSLEFFQFWTSPLTLLGVFTLLGLYLRLMGADTKSLWGDEICTVASALGHRIDPEAWSFEGKGFDPSGVIPAGMYATKAFLLNTPWDWGATVEALKANVHPPLYFWMLHGVIHAWGWAPLTLRLPSILLSTLSIPLMGWVGFQLGSNDRWKLWLSLGGSLVMALSGYQLAHAQDARPYPLLLCVGLLLTGLVLWLIRHGAQSKEGRLSSKMTLAFGGLLGGVSLLGLYTQYLFALYLMVHGVLTFIYRRHIGHLKTLWLGWGGITLLGFAPWIPIYLEQRQFFQNAGHFTSGLWNPTQLPEQLWRSLCDLALPDDPWFRVAGLLMMALLAWEGWKTVQQRPVNPAQQDFSGFQFLAWWGGLLILAHGAFDLLQGTHTLTIKRYLFLLTPVVYLTLVSSVFPWTTQRNQRSFQFNKPLVAVCIALGIWMMSNSGAILRGEKFHSDDFQGAAHWITQHGNIDHDAVLVYRSGPSAVGVAHYLPPTMAMSGISPYGSQNGIPISTDKAWRRKQREIGKIQTIQRVWLVFSHTNAKGDQEVIDKWMTHQPGQWRPKPKLHKELSGVRIFLLEKSAQKS